MVGQRRRGEIASFEEQGRRRRRRRRRRCRLLFFSPPRRPGQRRHAPGSRCSGFPFFRGTLQRREKALQRDGSAGCDEVRTRMEKRSSPRRPPSPSLSFLFSFPQPLFFAHLHSSFASPNQNNDKKRSPKQDKRRRAGRRRHCRGRPRLARVLPARARRGGGLARLGRRRRAGAGRDGEGRDRRGRGDRARRGERQRGRCRVRGAARRGAGGRRGRGGT